jgi:1-acyl-sn-glycerol-3-phosphate acyltransferase
MMLVTLLVALSAGAWGVRRLGQAHSEADWGGPWLNGLDGLNRLFCRGYHRLRVDHIDLPATGSALVVSNHVSGLDPLLMIAASRRPLRFIIAREEYERPGLKWLFKAIGCIPVDRNRRPELALRLALRALQAGEVVALFPHGRIHLDNHPPRKLKGGVAWLARRARCPVIPVRIEGVRAQGAILPAVFLRSHARLRGFPGVDCAGAHHDDCLEELARHIEGRAARVEALRVEGENSSG